MLTKYKNRSTTISLKGSHCVAIVIKSHSELSKLPHRFLSDGIKDYSLCFFKTDDANESIKINDFVPLQLL